MSTPNQQSSLSETQVYKIAQEATKQLLEASIRKNEKFFPIDDLMKKGWESCEKYFEFLMNLQRDSIKADILESTKDQMLHQLIEQDSKTEQKMKQQLNPLNRIIEASQKRIERLEPIK